ncbi:COMM domain-containing protein 5-like [Dysidea avara]|uniref:COMM domain-containing protein 5-like n=1 Tax=Dysidea avara TaxID=196820 RepID=UPI003323127D
MSVVQVMGGGKFGGNLAADRTPFYGIRLPDEVKKSIAILKQIDQDSFRKILKLVVQYLETGVIEEEQFLKMTSAKLTEDNLRILFAALMMLLRSALRQPTLKSEVFVEDLKQIKYPEQVIVDLNSAAFGSRRIVLDRCAMDQRVRLPQLDNMRWRVDVIISNSSLHRVLEPSILMEMKLSDGSIKTFEVPASKFHELRYSVTSVLKEMQDLEKRNILKMKT